VVPRCLDSPLYERQHASLFGLPFAKRKQKHWHPLCVFAKLRRGRCFLRKWALVAYGTVRPNEWDEKGTRAKIALTKRHTLLVRLLLNNWVTLRKQHEMWMHHAVHYGTSLAVQGSVKCRWKCDGHFSLLKNCFTQLGISNCFCSRHKRMTLK
jgi:hypothetical protein